MRSPTRPHRPRAAAWAGLWLAVLWVHVALLGALMSPAVVPPAPATARHDASLRWVTVAAAAPVPAVPAPMPAAVAASPAVPPRAVRPQRAAMTRATALAAVRAPQAVTAASATSAARDGADAPAVTALPAPNTHEAAPTAGAELPVYATRLPDPVRLHYRLQRGEQTGSASLQWQTDADGYTLRLDTDWPGRPAQATASRGRIDADGVAPVRHAELKRAREVRAVNFQREAGQITFSGPQAVYVLRAGAQDRLSWMIQLPGIVQADAALARPGAQVLVFVAGTRGDAEAWRFEVLGRETLQLPAGPVADALRLRREPTRPYDTRVEVWLDPSRQHLPVQARFTTLPGGVPLELLLADAAGP